MCGFLLLKNSSDYFLCAHCPTVLCHVIDSVRKLRFNEFFTSPEPFGVLVWLRTIGHRKVRFADGQSGITPVCSQWTGENNVTPFFFGV